MEGEGEHPVALSAARQACENRRHAIAMIATSAGFDALALSSRTDPIPWTVSKACNLRSSDSIKELVDFHPRVFLLQPSIGVQWQKRNLQHRTQAYSEGQARITTYSLAVRQTTLQPALRRCRCSPSQSSLPSSSCLWGRAFSERPPARWPLSGGPPPTSLRQ